MWIRGWIKEPWISYKLSDVLTLCYRRQILTVFCDPTRSVTYNKKRNHNTWLIAQFINCLLPKSKDLFWPQNGQIQGMGICIAHIRDPSVGNVQATHSLGLQASLAKLVSLRPMKDIINTYIHTNMHAYIHNHEIQLYTLLKCIKIIKLKNTNCWKGNKLTETVIFHRTAKGMEN